LKTIYRDLLKHSSIYGVGQIFARCASLALMPLYTRCLGTIGYGCFAVLDLTQATLGIVIGSGVVAAVNRYHFETSDERERDKVWWSGLGYLALMATAVVTPFWLVRDSLAYWTLGGNASREAPAVVAVSTIGLLSSPGGQGALNAALALAPARTLDGSFYYALALPGLWLLIVGELLFSYMQVRMWSRLYVGLSATRLTINVGLNVIFLTKFEMGVGGILLGNLISQFLGTTVAFVIFARDRRACRLDRHTLAKLLRFGTPFIAFGLLSLIMHQSDRYLLLAYAGLAEIGVYALAAMMGQALNTLCLLPFSNIWGVAMYEIDRQPYSRRIYARVFEYFVYGLLLVVLGVSLFAEPILKILAPQDFQGAAPLIPVICLGYVVFSLHEHFKVPALLAKRPLSFLPSSFAAAICKIVATIFFVRLLGVQGAAWALLLTFVTYSFGGLWRFRKIERIDYPFLKCALVCAGMAITYVACRACRPIALAYVLSGIAWAAWALLLMAKPARLYLFHTENAEPANVLKESHLLPASAPREYSRPADEEACVPR
jgi:O-antigen/teichoic acid export membrane protein